MERILAVKQQHINIFLVMPEMRSICYSAILVLMPFFCACRTAAPGGTIKVMTYNVLHYGNGCQGPDGVMHRYLQTIVDYAQPDILGLIKVAAIPQGGADKAKAPAGFADSILAYGLNASLPGRYAYCPFTNRADDKDQNILFYNRQKMGFTSMVTLVSDVSDIDMYKLYWRSRDLPTKRDTAFLYIVLLHTDSGDEADTRDRQLEELVNELLKKLPANANIVVMGDFNLRKTNEAGYQALIANHFTDPPFGIDRKVQYPANWDKHPERYSPYLTTSTRKKQGKPNDCGTGGGAKGWYDHILLSAKITGGSGEFRYRRGSYKTIGNDGKRIDISVNDLPNNSAPARVLDALYQMSNKYPVMLELTTGNQ